MRTQPHDDAWRRLREEASVTTSSIKFTQYNEDWLGMVTDRVCDGRQSMSGPPEQREGAAKYRRH